MPKIFKKNFKKYYFNIFTIKKKLKAIHYQMSNI